MEKGKGRCEKKMTSECKWRKEENMKLWLLSVLELWRDIMPGKKDTTLKSSILNCASWLYQFLLSSNRRQLDTRLYASIVSLYDTTTVVLVAVGEVIRPGDIRCILNEGMPQYRRPFDKGRLIVCFAVKFPQENWIGPEKYVALEQLLPARREVLIPDNAEGCVMHKFDPSSSSSSASASYRRRMEAYDSDDDEMRMGGQQFQCASHWTHTEWSRLEFSSF